MNRACFLLGLALFVVGLAFIAGCGEGEDPAEGRYDPTPEKLDRTPSYEFEQDDIERAEEASPEVKDYCAGAVSEAQRIGCEAHVDPGDVP